MNDIIGRDMFEWRAEQVRMDEAYGRIDDMRAQSKGEFSVIQRLGGATMTMLGRVGYWLGASHEQPTPLERHAYDPRFKAARRVWAGVGAVVATATLLAGAGVADATDNHFACGGESTTVELPKGGTLEALAEAHVSHENTPVGVVVDEIAARNAEMVDAYVSTGQPDFTTAQPGTYEVPTECDSNIAIFG